jgi:site-specific DNA recombinase
MRAAIYARVSTDSQQQRGTIGSQLAVLRARVADEGDECIGEFCDDGHSGARLDRPGLDGLRDAAEAGLIERVWCLSPDRLARVYAYQVIVLDELARHRVTVAFADAPPLGDDPQSKLLTQVQGVIAEYERAKIAERYRRGKLFRSRAGEVLAWRTPYGYRRLPRDTSGPARLEIYEPEAAVVRRIFADTVAGGHSTREIARRLAADAVPTPKGRGAVWGTSTIGRLLRNEAYIGRVYFNRTESVPDPRPGRRNKQVPRPKEEWITIPVPAIVTDEIFGAAKRVSHDNSKWSPRRAEPGQWLLKGLVRCGVCGVGTNCHKMRGRNGTWHRYYYCRNHDPLRAGGQDRRCPERNIRSDALDTFVFDQVRAALLRPNTLLAGEQAVTSHTPTPDDELLAVELAHLDRKLTAADDERRRLADLYQAGLLALPELQQRAADVEHRHRDLTDRRDNLTAQRRELTRDNQLRNRVTGFAQRVLTVIDHLDFEQKQALLRLVVDEVRVTGWKVEIQLRIPLDDNGGNPPPSPPEPPADDQPPLSTQDRLRSLGGPEGRQLPTTQPRHRHPAQHQNPRHGRLETNEPVARDLTAAIRQAPSSPGVIHITTRGRDWTALVRARARSPGCLRKQSPVGVTAGRRSRGTSRGWGLGREAGLRRAGPGLSRGTWSGSAAKPVRRCSQRAGSADESSGRGPARRGPAALRPPPVHGAAARRQRPPCAP